MGCATPATIAVETLVEPEVPAVTGTAAGLAVIEKSFGGSCTAPLTETLSKPTLSSWPVLCDVTKSPTVAEDAIVRVFLPMRFQFTPSSDCQAVKVLPARCSFSHLFGER